MDKKPIHIITAVLLTAINSQIIFAANINSDKCINGIKPQGSYIIKNTTKRNDGPNSYSETTKYKYDFTIGNCYKIKGASLVYRLDNHHALYKVLGDDYFSDYILAVDFGYDKARLNGFSGIVKTSGVYEYPDRKGIPRRIPSVTVVK